VRRPVACPNGWPRQAARDRQDRTEATSRSRCAPPSFLQTVISCGAQVGGWRTMSNRSPQMAYGVKAPVCSGPPISPDPETGFPAIHIDACARHQTVVRLAHVEGVTADKIVMAARADPVAKNQRSVGSRGRRDARRMRTSLRHPSPSFGSGSEKATLLVESVRAGLFVSVAGLEVTLRRKVVVDRG
jgi:hypothetical protein